MPQKKHEFVEGWLAVCEDNSDRLTKWEENFIASIREQLDQGRVLTELQIETLERIYAERTP